MEITCHSPQPYDCDYCSFLQGSVVACEGRAENWEKQGNNASKEQSHCGISDLRAFRTAEELTKFHNAIGQEMNPRGV